MNKNTKSYTEKTSADTQLKKYSWQSKLFNLIMTVGISTGGIVSCEYDTSTKHRTSNPVSQTNPTPSPYTVDYNYMKKFTTEEFVYHFNKANTTKNNSLDINEINNYEKEYFHMVVSENVPFINLAKNLHALNNNDEYGIEYLSLYLDPNNNVAIMDDYTHFIELLSNYSHTFTKDQLKTIITDKFITKEQRIQLKFPFDKPILDKKTGLYHNYWDKAVSQDGGITITLEDLKKNYYNLSKNRNGEFAIEYFLYQRDTNSNNLLYKVNNFYFGWTNTNDSYWGGNISNLTTGKTMKHSAEGGWSLYETPEKTYLIAKDSTRGWGIHDRYIYDLNNFEYLLYSGSNANGYYKLGYGYGSQIAEIIDSATFANKLVKTYTLNLNNSDKYFEFVLPDINKTYLVKAENCTTLVTLQGYAFLNIETGVVISNFYKSIVDYVTLKSKPAFIVYTVNGYAFLDPDTDTIISDYYNYIYNIPVLHNGEMCYRATTKNPYKTIYISVTTGNITY